MYQLKTLFLLIWCHMCLSCHVWERFENVWNYINFSRCWCPKLTPTANGVLFERAQQAAYIPTTLQDKNLIFKDAAKLSFFSKKKRLPKSRTNFYRTIFKWWTAVEIKTVKTQPKQQHVTYEIVRFKIQCINYNMVFWITIWDCSSSCSTIAH